MKLFINGKEFIKEPCTIFELLEDLEITHKAMAIALNSEVVKKEQWKSQALQEGDCVEILDFVGGG